MDKTEISKDSLKITFPKIAPYKCVGDYFKSKAFFQQVQMRSYECDEPRIAPELNLTSSHRAYDRVEEALVRRREFYKKERRKLDAQWDHLYIKEKEFRENFEKLNTFIVSNGEKRLRAREQGKEDLKLRLERTNEIEKLEVKLAYANERKKEVDTEILKLRLYEVYLNSVASESATEFKNASEIVDRFESLVKTKNELGRRQNKCLDELEHARAKTARISDEFSLRILGLNNIAGDLRARYSRAKRSAMHWESTVWNIKNRAFQKFQEINEVKQACWNIYRLMCKRKDEALKIPEEDFEKQLSYIKKTLQELKKVTDEAKASSKQITFSSVKGETSKVS